MEKRIFWNKKGLLSVALFEGIIALLITVFVLFMGVKFSGERIGVLAVVALGGSVLVAILTSLITLSNKLVFQLRDDSLIRIPINRERDIVECMEMIDYPYHALEVLRYQSPYETGIKRSLKRICTWLGIMVGCALTCVVLWYGNLHLEIEEIQSYCYGNAEDVTVKNIIESCWENGTWRAFLVENNKDDYIMVEYKKGNDKIYFRSNKDKLEIIALKFDGEYVESQEECEKWFLNMTERYCRYYVD